MGRMLTSPRPASTMRFIAQYTSIPVPKVYCAFHRCGRTYILMERIAGDEVGKGWVRRSDESKAQILSQLKDFIHEMRKIPPPGPDVANIDGGSFFDWCDRMPAQRFGPFPSIHAFHEFLHAGLKQGPQRSPSINNLIAQHEAPWSLLAFTHGDLHPFNILAKGDQVVGVLDWENAGWFPSYWEYTATCEGRPMNQIWLHEIDQFLDPYPTELAMERIRLRYFNPF